MEQWKCKQCQHFYDNNKQHIIDAPSSDCIICTRDNVMETVKNDNEICKYYCVNDRYM